METTTQTTEGWQVQKPVEQITYHYFVAGRALCGAIEGYAGAVEPCGPGDKDDCGECEAQIIERERQ